MGKHSGIGIFGWWMQICGCFHMINLFVQRFLWFRHELMALVNTVGATNTYQLSRFDFRHGPALRSRAVTLGVLQWHAREQWRDSGPGKAMMPSAGPPTWCPQALPGPAISAPSVYMTTFRAKIILSETHPLHFFQRTCNEAFCRVAVWASVLCFEAHSRSTMSKQIQAEVL